MALDFSTENMGELNILFEGSCEQNFDIDISLPDYCTDISRVLKCCVIPGIASAKISGDRACADGNALIRIVYTDEDNNICTYEQNAPFSKFVQSGADIQGILRVESKVQYVNCRATGKRRAEVHSAIVLCFKIFTVSKKESICSIDRKTVQAQNEKVEFWDIITAECKQFNIGETVELPSDYLPAQRIVSCCATPVLHDTRVVKDKILIKGEVCFSITYCPEEGGGETVRFDHSVSINQVIDAQGINENCTAGVRLRLLNCECNLRNDANSMPRLFETDCIVEALIKAYLPSEINCITDAYCLDGHLDTSYEKREFLSLSEHIRETVTEKFIIDLPSSDSASISCIWWEEPVVNCTLHNSLLTLHSVILINIIAKDSDGRHTFCERELCFDFTKNVDTANCGIYDYSITPIGFNCSVPSGSKTEIKGEFLIEGDIFCKKDIVALTHADVIPQEKKSSSCVVVYFPEEEEKLWNIARKFNTTVDMIKDQNSLSGDLAVNGNPLLIPVK